MGRGCSIGSSDNDDLRMEEVQQQRQDEDLALFHEMRTREIDNFLHPSVDDIERVSLGSKYRIATSITQNQLGLEPDKNDYDWLLTPPSTPLFSSLEDGPPDPGIGKGPASKLSAKCRAINTTTTTRTGTRDNASPRRASSPSSSDGSRFRSSSPCRPSTPNAGGSRTSTPTRSSPSLTRSASFTRTPTPTRPGTSSRPGTPTRTSTTPTRGATPTRTPSPGTARAFTPTRRALTTSLYEPSSITPRRNARSSSPSPKPKTVVHPAMPDVSEEPPPNLRTSINRPGSNPRGASLSPKVANRSRGFQVPETNDRKRPVSPSLSRSSSTSSSMSGSVISSQSSGVEVNRQVAPKLTTGQPRRPTVNVEMTSPKPRAVNSPGSAKKTSDSLTSPRQMDFRRSSTTTGFRPLMANNHISSFYSRASMSLQNRNMHTTTDSSNNSSIHESDHEDDAFSKDGEGLFSSEKDMENSELQLADLESEKDMETSKLQLLESEMDATVLDNIQVPSAAGSKEQATKLEADACVFPEGELLEECGPIAEAEDEDEQDDRNFTDQVLALTYGKVKQPDFVAAVSPSLEDDDNSCDQGVQHQTQLCSGTMRAEDANQEVITEESLLNRSKEDVMDDDYVRDVAALESGISREAEESGAIKETACLLNESRTVEKEVSGEETNNTGVAMKDRGAEKDKVTLAEDVDERIKETTCAFEGDHVEDDSSSSVYENVGWLVDFVIDRALGIAGTSRQPSSSDLKEVITTAEGLAQLKLPEAAPMEAVDTLNELFLSPKYSSSLMEVYQFDQELRSKVSEVEAISSGSPKVATPVEKESHLESPRCGASSPEVKISRSPRPTWSSSKQYVYPAARKKDYSKGSSSSYFSIQMNSSKGGGSISSRPFSTDDSHSSVDTPRSFADEDETKSEESYVDYYIVEPRTEPARVPFIKEHEECDIPATGCCEPDEGSYVDYYIDDSSSQVAAAAAAAVEMHPQVEKKAEDLSEVSRAEADTAAAECEEQEKLQESEGVSQDQPESNDCTPMTTSVQVASTRTTVTPPMSSPNVKAATIDGEDDDDEFDVMVECWKQQEEACLEEDHADDTTMVPPETKLAEGNEVPCVRIQQSTESKESLSFTPLDKLHLSAEAPSQSMKLQDSTTVRRSLTYLQGQVHGSELKKDHPAIEDHDLIPWNVTKSVEKLPKQPVRVSSKCACTIM